LLTCFFKLYIFLLILFFGIILFLNDYFCLNYLNFLYEFIFKNGDWGLGIGDWDWAQSPIPNPQSPIPIKIILNLKIN